MVELLPTAEESGAVGHLGPDPLRADWDPEEAVRRLGADPARPVVAALLDQTRIAGLGNLWVNELCSLRGVSPWTPAGDVDLPPLAATTVRVAAEVEVTGDPERRRTWWCPHCQPGPGPDRPQP